MNERKNQEYRYKTQLRTIEYLTDMARKADERGDAEGLRKTNDRLVQERAILQKYGNDLDESLREFDNYGAGDASRVHFEDDPAMEFLEAEYGDDVCIDQGNRVCLSKGDDWRVLFREGKPVKYEDPIPPDDWDNGMYQWVKQD